MGRSTAFPAANSPPSLSQQVRRRKACNFSRSTKPSRTSPSRARIIWIWKPRRFPKASRNRRVHQRASKMHASPVDRSLAPSPSGHAASTSCRARQPKAKNGEQPAQPAAPAAAAPAPEPTPEQSALIAICIGSFIKVTSSNLPTALSKPPRSPCRNRRSRKKLRAPAPAEGATPEAAAPQANAETDAAPVEISADSMPVAVTENPPEQSAPAEQSAEQQPAEAQPASGS